MCSLRREWRRSQRDDAALVDLCCARRDRHTGIEVVLSTSRPDGLVLWMGDPTSDLVALGLRAGALQLE